jgi:hypothetical protein
MLEEQYVGEGPTGHEDEDNSPEDENLQNGHDPDFDAISQYREEDDVVGTDEFQEDDDEEPKEDDEEVNEDNKTQALFELISNVQKKDIGHFPTENKNLLN